MMIDSKFRGMSMLLFFVAMVAATMMGAATMVAGRKCSPTEAVVSSDDAHKYGVSPPDADAQFSIGADRFRVLLVDSTQSVAEIVADGFLNGKEYFKKKARYVIEGKQLDELLEKLPDSSAKRERKLSKLFYAYDAARGVWRRLHTHNTLGC